MASHVCALLENITDSVSPRTPRKNPTPQPALVLPVGAPIPDTGVGDGEGMCNPSEPGRQPSWRPCLGYGWLSLPGSAIWHRWWVLMCRASSRGPRD